MRWLDHLTETLVEGAEVIVFTAGSEHWGIVLQRTNEYVVIGNEPDTPDEFTSVRLDAIHGVQTL